MKVGIVAGLMNPKRGGGAPVSINKLVSGLSSHHDTTVLAGDPVRIPGVSVINPNLLIRIRFSVLTSLRPSNIFANWKQAAYLLRYFYSVNKLLKNSEYDVVDAHGPWTDLQDVLTVRYCLEAYYQKCSRQSRPDGVYGSLTSILDIRMHILRWIERRSIYSEHCKGFICVSNKVRDELKQYYDVPENKLHVVTNAVDLSSFQSVSTHIRPKKREEWGVGKNDVIYSFIGTNPKRKHLGDFLHTIESLQDASAWALVVGVKDISEYQAKYTDIAERIIHIPWSDNIAEMLSASDVFVLPTEYDTCAKVVLEAMAAENVVITTYESGCDHVVKNNVTGFLLSGRGHLQQLKDVVHRVHHNPNLRTRVVNEAKKIQGKDWSQVIAEQKRVYKIVAEQN